MWKDSLVCAKLMRFSGPAARLVHFLFAIFVVLSFWRRINLFNDRLPVREIAMNVITEMMWSNHSNFSASELHSYCGSKYKSTKFFEFHFSVSSPLSAGSASSALPSGSSSGSSGSLVSELHRRFSSMQGTTHRSSAPVLWGLWAALRPL